MFINIFKTIYNKNYILEVTPPAEEMDGTFIVSILFSDDRPNRKYRLKTKKDADNFFDDLSKELLND